MYSEIVPHDATAAELAKRRPAGLILSGGPASVYEEGAPTLDAGLFDMGIPVLGICYGHQLMAQALGGEVAATGQREYGGTTLSVDQPGGVLLADFGAEEQVWMSHGDAVTRAPEGFRVTARTEQIPIAAMEDPERALFAVQFHPEVSHTPRGQDVLKRFLYEGCGLLPDWTPINIVEDAVARIRAQVGDAEVLCALSGGVDSSVAALLVHRAVGDQLTCVFVDHGLNREGEPQQVEETFGRHFGVPLVHVKAEDRFLAKLAGVTDPERKRRAIGEEFIRVFEEVAREHRDAHFLVQGTLYPDVIESGSRTAANIKSHHNVGGPSRGDGARARGAAPRSLQGRGPPGGRGAGTPRGGRATPAVPGPRARGADRGRGDGREPRQGPRRRSRRARGDPPGGTRAGDLAGVLRLAGRHEDRGRHGRRPDL